MRRFLLLLALGACSRPEPATHDVVRLGYQRYISYAPIFIADAEGYFARHGITVEMVLMPDGNTGTPLVVSGEIDALAGPASPGILNAIARGAKVRLVADKGSVPDSGCSQMALVGRPGIDINGARRVSPGRATAALEFFTEKALAQSGISLNDLEVHHIPTTVHMEALSRSGIDAVATTEPNVSRLVTAGNQVLRDAQAVVPGLPYGFIVFGERLTSRERTVGERFMAAYVEGIEAYAAGKTDRNLSVVSAATGDEPDVLARACWPPFRTEAIDTAAFGVFQDWAVTRKLLDRRLGVNEYWDGSFLDSARAKVNAR